MHEKLNEFKDEQELLGELEMAAVTEQVMGKIQSSFETLSEFLGECSVSSDEFSALLLSGLSSVEISLIPLQLDSVIVQSKTDGMKDIKKLFVLGASEGKFPVTSEDCGMIRDSEINSLSDIFKVKIEPTIKTINRRERCKAFETVIGFDEVQISFAKTNQALEELSASSFVMSVAGLFDDYKIAGETVLNQVNASKNEFADCASGVFTLENLESRFAAMVAGTKNGKSVAASDLSSVYHVIKDGSRMDFENMLGSQTRVPELSSESVEFLNGKTSISQLEKYFSCPFMHFADYGLGLKDRAEAKMQAIDVGDVLHKVAEIFVKKFIKNGGVQEEEHSKIVDEVLLSNKIATENNKMLVSILEKEAHRLMRAISNQLAKSDFKPVAVEAWFGKNGAFPAIELGDGVRIEVKIDRVDKCGDHYRVIDYKTGKIEETPEGVYYGKKVQLLSYVQAIAGGDKKLKPAAALYFPVRNEWAESKKKAEEAYKNKGYVLKDEDVVKHMDTDLYHSNTSTSIPVRFVKAKGTSDPDEREFGADGNLLDEKQFEDIAKYIHDLEKQAVKEIMSGYIAPSPLVSGNKSPCAYCAYKTVCGLEKTSNPEGRKALGGIKFESFLKGE